MLFSLKRIFVISSILVIPLVAFGYLSYTLGSVNKELKQLKSEFVQYQQLTEKNETLSHKFYKELTDAKIENNRQFYRVLSGIGKLQLNTGED